MEGRSSVSHMTIAAVLKSFDQSDEWILENVTELLGQLGSQLDVTRWESPKGVWGSRATENVQQLHATRDVMENAHSWVKPSYLLWFVGFGAKVVAKLDINVGANYVGDPGPAHFVNVSLRGVESGVDVLPYSRGVVESVVGLFDPSYVVARTIPVWKTEKRSGWKIGSGYVCWFSDDLGEISVVPDGLTARRLGAGTLVEAPAEWDASRVVASGRALREANGIDHVPH